MENNQKDSANEIDLLEVLGKVWHWVERIVQIVFVFFVRKSLWFISFIAVILIGDYITYKATKPLYYTVMTAKMNVLDNAFAINHINELNASATSGPEFWMAEFNLPDTAIAKHINFIGGYWGVAFSKQRDYAEAVDFKGNYARDTVNNRRIEDRFYVAVKVYNKDVQPYLTKGVVDNICNNQFAQEQNNLRKAQLQERISELSRQIRVLDSLQRYEYFLKDAKVAKPSGGQLMVLAEKEKTLYHNEILKLYSERQKLERELQLNPDPVTVIQGFGVTSQLEVKFIDTAKQAVVFGFFLALIAALVWDNRKWLIEKIVKPRK
ncbi:MAG: hypothetical protein LBK47_07100 [Prevotellaceae bacterium]|nr:hypothetical protein [Prevotellaceae bacterium]